MLRISLGQQPSTPIFPGGGRALFPEEPAPGTSSNTPYGPTPDPTADKAIQDLLAAQATQDAETQARLLAAQKKANTNTWLWAGVAALVGVTLLGTVVAVRRKKK